MESERVRTTVIPGNESVGASFDQRDLSTYHVVVEPVGQPTKEYESWKFFDIRIEPSLAEYLRALGGGEISEGVRIATQFYQAAECKRDK